METNPLHKTTATIYAGPDENQVVEIEYSGAGRRCFQVDHLKVLSPLELEPSDLDTDLSVAICDDQHAVAARIECEIEYHRTHLFKYQDMPKLALH